MALPVTLAHHDLETPIDLVARLAVANGFPSLREFLDHTDTNARAIVEGDVDALAMVSEWSAVPVSRLARLVSERATQGGTWRMGCATFSKDMRTGRTMRFCAKCVLDDREREPGRMVARAYRRASWAVRGIDGCQTHGCALTEIDVDADVDLHDFPHFVKTNLPLIEASAASTGPCRQPALDRFLVDRMVGVGEHGFLRQLDPHVVAEFSRYLGELLKRHDATAWIDDETNAHEWGFRLASQGETEIRRVFADIIERERPTTKYVEKFLGPMLLWFRRNFEKPAYQPLVDLMQDIMERNMPFGEGQVIVKPVQSRHLYCVNSAHAEFGMSKDRIRALMKANDPDFRDGLADGSTYFDAAALRPILQAANDALTSKEAGALLGLREERVLELLKEGILAQVETRDGGLRPFARITTAAVTDLTQRLCERMTSVEDDKGLMPLNKASVSYRHPFWELVKMILDGSLQAFIMPGNDPVLRRARVKPVKPVQRKADCGRLGGATEELMRLNEAELALGTTHGTINDLIKRGYLRQRSVVRETGRLNRFIERASLAEFNAAYISLTAIRKARQGYRVTIMSELAALSVLPIFEPEGFNARFYSRADLERVGYKV